MEYPELSKLFHMDTSAERESKNKAELERRKSMDSTFIIKILDDMDDLFITMPREMSVLVEKVLRAERKCSSMMRSIPPIGRSALVRGLVLDEVVSTNAIENVNSTRKQIEDALDYKDSGDYRSRRFKELAILYLGLADNDSVSFPKEPKDIREIYDGIMEGELKDSDKPDGTLFRKDTVSITAGGVKVVHTGVVPELKIIEGLENMIALTNRDDIPSLISSIASHYIFEYIHPFYDGNGRTGRYLLALSLNDVLSTPTVLSLSRSIEENKNKYYSAFASVENKLNHGEMTHFVYEMLELVRIAQSGTMMRLQESIDRFHSVAEKCKLFFEANDLNSKEKDIVFALAQYDLFGMVGAVAWDNIAEAIDLSKQMTRKHLNSLEEKEIIEVASRRPLRFTLSDNAKQELDLNDYIPSI